MNSNRLLSIIVPIYNTGDKLTRTLNSVRNQIYQNYECILINDGSVDNSEAICQNYCNIDERFKYFYQDNQGVSVARNLGLSKSSGYYVTFLDSDDVIDCNMYSSMINAMEMNQADISSCGVIKEQKYIESKDFSEPDFELVSNPLALINYDNHAWTLPIKIFTRELIGDLRFDSRLLRSEDILFVTELFNRCKLLVKTPKKMYHYINYVKVGSSLSKRDLGYPMLLGDVIARKRMLEIFTYNNLDKQIHIAWDRYGKCIFGLFRYAIQKRDKCLYNELRETYSKDIESFFTYTDEKFVKKLSYITYYKNYHVASLVHFYFKKSR